MNWVRTWAALAAAAIAWGSGWQSDPAVDSVKIVSISPTTGTLLRVGETLTLQVEIEYNLTSAESGTVTLVIQQGESGRPALANEIEVVTKGRAKVVLSKQL